MRMTYYITSYIYAYRWNDTSVFFGEYFFLQFRRFLASDTETYYVA